MSFNTDLTRKDIEFLDMLRDTAKYPEDYLYYNQMVDVLIGSLDTNEDWLAYFKRIKELYGKDDNNDN
jgi:hypothetical protein